MAVRPTAGSALPKLKPVDKFFSAPALANADGSQPRVRLAGPDAQPPEIRGWCDLGDYVTIAAGNTENARQCINRHFRESEYGVREANDHDGSEAAAVTTCYGRNLPNLDTPKEIGSITNVAFVQWEDDASHSKRRLVSNTTAKQFIAQYVKTDRGRALAKEMAQVHSMAEANVAPAGSFEQRAALTGAEDSAVAAQAVPLLGMPPAPAAANNHHVVSSRGDVNINVGAPAAAPDAGPLAVTNATTKIELKALPVAGLAAEVESVRDIDISDELKNALIESRIGVVVAVNNSIKSIAVSNANKAKLEEEEVRSRKRHQEEMGALDKKHKGVMDELAELGESATLLRNNGGMTATASRALAMRVLTSAELGAEVQASSDHVLQGIVHQASDYRTAKEHQELRTGVPVPPNKLKTLREDVKKAYKLTTGNEPEGNRKKDERNASGRGVYHADAYPTSWLEQQRDLFARLARS